MRANKSRDIVLLRTYAWQRLSWNFFVTQITSKKYRQGLYDQIQTRIYDTFLRIKTGNFIYALNVFIYVFTKTFPSGSIFASLLISPTVHLLLKKIYPGCLCCTVLNEFLLLFQNLSTPSVRHQTKRSGCLQPASLVSGPQFRIVAACLISKWPTVPDCGSQSHIL